MSQDVLLAAEERESVGKKAIAKLRSGGKVPAVVQESGKESINIQVDSLQIIKAYEAAGKSQPIDLDVGGKKKLALIKQIEFVPLKPEVQHVVFQALKQNEAVDAEVPVHIVGEVPAEANRLVLLKTLDTLMVRALPRDLPEALDVSAESLVEIDDKVTVRDIKLPEGVELVEILANAEDEEKQQEFLDQPIALVKEPSIIESDEGVEVEEGAEGEAVEGAEQGADNEPSDGGEAKEGEKTE